MKTRLHSLLLVVALASLSAPFGYSQTRTAAAKPDIKFDGSPLGDGGGRRVTSYADVVEPVQKAVVSVYSTKIVRERLRVDPFFQQLFRGRLPEREREEKGLGSGVIVSPDGYILTNHHVVAGADELKVLLSDGREMIAKVIGTDEKTDVAVIKIDGDSLPVVPITDSDRIRVGDVVFAVGNPLGVGQTVTMGIVSATGRTIPDEQMEAMVPYQSFIQTDAAINQGNSGGALVDAKGRLVGLNSAILSSTGGNIGIGFAVPTNLAVSILNSLVTTGKVQRGYLGVGGQNLDPGLAESLGVDRATKGVVVTNVVKDAPAGLAGLKRNDIIVRIDNKPVDSQSALRLLVSQVMPGTEVAVVVLRDGKEKTFKIKLGTLGEQAAASGNFIPGVTVKTLDDELRAQFKIDQRVENGIVITAIEDNSPFANILVPGLVIVEINRVPVADVTAAAASVKPGLNALLVQYRGVLRYVTINLK